MIPGIGYSATAYFRVTAEGSEYVHLLAALPSSLMFNKEEAKIQMYCQVLFAVAMLRRPNETRNGKARRRWRRFGRSHTQMRAVLGGVLTCKAKFVGHGRGYQRPSFDWLR